MCKTNLKNNIEHFKRKNTSDMSSVKNVHFFRNQGGKMLYAWYVGLTKDVAYPLKPLLFSSNKVTSRKSKKL